MKGEDGQYTHSFLAQVRRLEAVSFRSFPSTSTFYDGTWAIRLTAGHPAKRLNSVNPLDRSDHARIGERLALARQKFSGFGRPLVFRQSPLAPRELEHILDGMGWDRFDESLVMMLDLSSLDLSSAVDRVSLKDCGFWVRDYLKISQEDESLQPGLVEVISAIEPTCGLFVAYEGNVPIAAVRCVQDNDLAGIFDLVTAESHQRKGHARELVASALKWAKGRGARMSWLQVVEENVSALKLYEGFGFEELYRYAYRKAPN